MSRNRIFASFSNCLVWVIMLIVVGVIGLSAYTWATTNGATPASPVPSRPQSTAIKDATYPAMGGGPFTNLSDAQTVNQITLLVGNSREALGEKLGFTDNPQGLYFVTDFCLQTPNQRDWQIGAVSLTLQDKTFTEYSATYLGWFTAGGWLDANDPTATTQTHLQRCGFVAMPLVATAKGQPYKLEVRRLETAMPTTPDCAVAEQKLQSMGIQIRCQVDDAGLSYAITEKPATFSDAEAEQQVRDAFLEIANGPWVFAGTLTP